jgi:hypothetical protein
MSAETAPAVAWPRELAARERQPRVAPRPEDGGRAGLPRTGAAARPKPPGSLSSAG